MGVDISVIWFAIIVFATLMYIIMDGFDLGIGLLFNFVGDARERDVMVNSVAPVWDGNETWLVLGGAGLFGAFPLAYAVIIDALTIPLTAMLIGLIFRGVAFEFRFKATLHTASSGTTPLLAAPCSPPSARAWWWGR
jgi:cytochrome d ubiquinol oxidase subunit II